MSGDESKQFLYGFLSKNGIIPEYNIRPTGKPLSPIFLIKTMNAFRN